MPGRRPAATIDQSLCRRCQTVAPAITVRAEPLCNACFRRYVESKVVKRMESFRVRHSNPGQERKLLLPVSRDASSVALLHILSQQLKGQAEKTGRTGFKIHALYIDEDTPISSSTNRFARELEQRYPDHSYCSVHLSDALSDNVSDLISSTSFSDVNNNERLEQFLSTPKSATARQDLREILKRKLIVSLAKAISSEAILWSDTTTKLAERTLSETAKGRGSTLPLVVADGDSPHGIPFYFPLRELLGKEIESYVSLIEPALEQGIIMPRATPAVSTKNTTIDDLMQQYFASVEQEYPSIVANVVRTTGKLQLDLLANVESQCELCDLPLAGGAPEMSRLCYGCIRLLPQADI